MQSWKDSSWIWCAILTIPFLSTCSVNPNFPQTNAQATISPTFSAVQSQILLPVCGGCHSSAMAQGGVSVSTYAELMASAGAVSPYSPGASQIYKQTINGWMPKEGQPLTGNELQALYNWIAYGALND